MDLFKATPIYRVDRDTTRTSQQLEAQFAKVNQGDPCIMIGTQMLAKGHHFPDVTLVAVLNADAGFLSPDFRAPERSAQLIVQVAGRAGRAKRPGEVWIQTFQPENPNLVRLIEQGLRRLCADGAARSNQNGSTPCQANGLVARRNHQMPKTHKSY